MEHSLVEDEEKTTVVLPDSASGSCPVPCSAAVDLYRHLYYKECFGGSYLLPLHVQMHANLFKNTLNPLESESTESTRI